MMGKPFYLTAFVVTLLRFGLTRDICPLNCLSEQCDFEFQCESCQDGYWGPDCSSCSEFCEGGLCDMNTGNCASCQDGYWGPTCSNQCDYNCAECDMNTGAVSNSTCQIMHYALYAFLGLICLWIIAGCIFAPRFRGCVFCCCKWYVNHVCWQLQVICGIASSSIPEPRRDERQCIHGLHAGAYCGVCNAYKK